MESEIDALVAACGKKTSTLLQVLKETGARIGEALRLRWIDMDSEHNTLSINLPEKGSNARMFKISNKLAAMINALPRENDKIFGNTSYDGMENSFYNKRKHLAAKLQNPRLMNIHFHTLRHWKATTEYHKTNNFLHIVKILGHKDIRNTMIYTQLMEFESDDFNSAVAENIEQAKKLIEAGFEYVCTHESVMMFRK